MVKKLEDISFEAQKNELIGRTFIYEKNLHHDGDNYLLRINELYREIDKKGRSPDYIMATIEIFREKDGTIAYDILNHFFEKKEGKFICKLDNLKHLKEYVFPQEQSSPLCTERGKLHGIEW